MVGSSERLTSKRQAAPRRGNDGLLVMKLGVFLMLAVNSILVCLFYWHCTQEPVPAIYWILVGIAVTSAITSFGILLLIIAVERELRSSR